MLVEVRLGQVGGAAPPLDVAVEFTAEVTVGAVASALAPGPGAWTIRILSRGPTDLEGQSLFSNCGVRSGDLIAVVDVSQARQGTSESNATAILTCTAGPDMGQSWRLATGRFRLGRAQECDIQLTDPSVSRNNLEVVVDVGMAEVVDRGTVNGVLVNAVKVVGSAPIDVGARLKVGGSELELKRLLFPSGLRSDQQDVNRPPRVHAPFSPATIKFPDTPQKPGRQRLPWITLGATALFALGFLFMANSGGFGGIAFLLFSPLLLLAGSLESSYSQRKDFEDAKLQFTSLFMARLQQFVPHVAREVEHRRYSYPDPETVSVVVSEVNTRLWERGPQHVEFLSFRFGRGTVATSNVAEFELGSADEEVVAVAQRLEEASILHDVPIFIPLNAVGSMAVIGQTERTDSCLQHLVMQLCGLHSPSEVGLVVCLAPARQSFWEPMKWAPHVRTGGAILGRHGVAVGENDADSLLTAIETVLSDRVGLEEGKVGAAPALVLIIDRQLSVDPIRLNSLLSVGPRLGLKVIWVGESIGDVPREVASIARFGRDVPVEIMMVGEGERTQVSSADFVSWEKFAETMVRMSPLSDRGRRPMDDDIPGLVTIPSLMGSTVVLTDETAVLQRWTEGASGSAKQSLGAPVGALARGAMSLDLRTDGPHALVAGTTGSGKSEFLQSYVAALALSHSPKRINFLFVDYKGGAAFRDLEFLPHSVGMVTNLNKYEVRRVLVSLEAELDHRMRLLDEAKAGDLMKMEAKGHPLTPPSLVIVCDEFAALVKEVPEFVDGMVDVAQRGRSLGIHMILATQRPAGVITDNIRANTNMRVALRVTDEAESTDVVDSPLAGRIPTNLPGRAILRVGASELRSFQSAYVAGKSLGGPAGPDVKIGLFTLGGTDFSHAEQQAESLTSSNGDDGAPVSDATDLERIVKVTKAAAVADNVGKPRRPWQAPLEGEIDLCGTQLPLPENGYRLPIGVIDVPERQGQEPAFVDLAESGSLLVFGGSGSGKSVFCRTIASSMSLKQSRDAIRIYGIDCAGGQLGALEELAPVGSIIPGDDREGVTRLLRDLRQTIGERGELFASEQVSTLEEYVDKTGDLQTPRIMVLLDGYAAFYSLWEKFERGQYVEMLERIVAESRAAGIHFVITSDSKAAVGAALFGAIPQRIVLKMSNPDDYGNLGITGAPVDIGDPPGRGYIDPDHQFQVAVLGGKRGGAEQADALAWLAGQLSANRSAPPIRRLPEAVSLEQMSASTRPELVRIGIAASSLAPIEVDLSDESVIVFGPPRSGKSTTLDLLCAERKRIDPTLQTVLVLFRDQRETFADYDRVIVGATNFEEFLDELSDASEDEDEDEDEKSQRAVGERWLICVDDAPDLFEDGGSIEFDEVIRLGRGTGITAVVACDTGRAGEGYDPIDRLKKNRTGIILRPIFGNEDMLFYNDLPSAAGLPLPAGRGYWVSRASDPQLIQVAAPTSSALDA